MKKNLKAIALLLTASIIFSACKGAAPSGNLGTEAETVVETLAESELEEPVDLISAQQLASSIREKYEGSEKVVYVSPEYNLPRDHAFTGIDIGFNPLDLGHESITEIIGVYADPDFLNGVYVSFDIEDKGDNNFSIAIKPGQRGALAVSTQMFEDGKTISLGDDYYINQKENYEDWGNLGQYYLVQWVDLATGEKLEKPIVKIFTIEAELDTPQAQYYLTEDGSPEFRWQEVEGAETYYVLKVESFNGNISSAQAIGRTSETSWSPKNDDVDFMNEMFHNQTEKKNARDEEYHYAYYYAVIAAGEEGTSSVNKLFSEKEIISRLPYQVDFDAMYEENVSRTKADSIGLMPAQVPVIMCDDNVIMKTISYEMDNAKIKDEVWGSYDLDENGEMINLENIKVRILHVPYTIEGTTFRTVLKIENFDENTYLEELKRIEKRQNDLKGRGGRENGSITQDTTKSDKAVSNEVAVPQDAIFATSALGEYLAGNMLAGNEIISLKDFPESSDRELLIDAWSEAVYQNPLILGVEGAKIAHDNSFLMVTYSEDQKTMAAKQKEIRIEVERVVAEIITPDMTDLEKEIAINDYLCDTSEYDFDALTNAEENDFASVDEEFNDSFTPYGILIKKVGVCASYAGSFKLLADAAGLESIVVTGYLEGSLPHAWNRVKIEDEWITIDTTNNNNKFLVNAILNLPDDVAGLLLVEDDRYMGNDFINDYKASVGDREYYRVIDRYYSTEEIAEQLADALKNNPRVTLRTDYVLDDGTFQEIAQSVMEELNVESIYGFHWMGVITMALDSADLMAE